MRRVFAQSWRIFGIGFVLAGGLAVAGMTAAIYGIGPLAEPVERINYVPREDFDTSGFQSLISHVKPWRPDASFEEYADAYRDAVPNGLAILNGNLKRGFHPVLAMQKATLFHAVGDTKSAYETLDEVESKIQGTSLEGQWRYPTIFYKGVTALRSGENDNCVMCRGESACIFPISPAAVHTNPAGSRLAIQHFTEYLQHFPDDLEVKWLLNIAHMTLGEYPAKVDPRYLLKIEPFCNSEFDIGKFRDVSHLVGMDRLNEAGGAVMDDFDNDGLFDFAFTGWTPAEPMLFYRNKGDGTLENHTQAGGLAAQAGGLTAMQTDYNNDGYLDIFLPRGAWLPPPLAQRPSLLRNNRDGTFTDVAADAGLDAPTNSHSATWADYDNDGHLDVFVCSQVQSCLLYRNKGDGTFEEVSVRAGLPAGFSDCLGAAWLDVDNDGYPELYTNLWGLTGRLFKNNRDGTFTDATLKMGIDGPTRGFSCWAFDFDNDGWLDIFATSFSRNLAGVVNGILNEPHQRQHARLYHNLQGRGFQDLSQEAGVDKVYSAMGSNFGDLDNDGYLDFYLGTGDPSLSTLIPNRLFKNVAGSRFAEITASSRTGHLQKGHGVAIGDWDRNGSEDILIELGGAVRGDRYHNVLFQNPGQSNNWLSVKLVGVRTNKAAIGARIKVVTEGEQSLTVHRHVSSGSSFGANPLEQHIGLGKADRVARLEIYWPTSGTTQVFENIPANRGVVVTEFASSPEYRSWQPLKLPGESTAMK